MISKFTIPGTKVVCVKYKIKKCTERFAHCWVPLVVGETYTIREIVYEKETNKFGVALQEIKNELHHFGLEYCYNLSCFRYIDLPECLTSLLVCDKLPQIEETEKV